MSYYSIYNNLLNGKYQYSFNTPNYTFLGTEQLFQKMLKCFILIEYLDCCLNNQKNFKNSSYRTYDQILSSFFGNNKSEINKDFYHFSFSDVDNNNNNKIQRDEFKSYYVKRIEQNNGIKYDNPISPELAKIKQEAENIYNAIRGDEDSIGKNRYFAFLDILDETDGVLDKKFYSNNAQSLINRIKCQPNSVIKNNKSLAELIQEKLVKKNATPKPQNTYNETGKPYTQKRDFEIEQVHQGEIGDCFLLSTLSKHPKFIKDSGCLRWNKDGSAEVFFYDTDKKLINRYWKNIASGGKKCYHITKAELDKTEFELTKNNGTKQKVKINPKQDFTLKAIEIGYLKYCKLNYEKAMNGGNAAKVIRMLFGNEKYKDMTFWCKPSKYSIKDMENCIFVKISRTSDNDKKRNIGGKEISTKHAYIYNGYNPETKMVSISNPWNNNLKSKKDDIEIPWAQFKDIFEIELLANEKSPEYIPYLYRKNK